MNEMGNSDEVMIIKIFIWKRKLIYIYEWFYEMECLYGVMIRYDGAMICVVGYGERVLDCYGCIYNLLSR